MAELAPAIGPDEALIRRIQSGDATAFDRLVEVHAPRVYTLAFRMVGNADDAQDLAQEVFVRVYQALPRFRFDAAFSTWLHRIVANVCHDELSRRKRRPISLGGEECDDATAGAAQLSVGGETPEDAYLRAERQAALQRALLRLPKPSRMVIILHDVQGFSYQEMAEILHTELGTVKSRLNRARLMLREILSAKGEQFRVEASQKI